MKTYAKLIDGIPVTTCAAAEDADLIAQITADGFLPYSAPKLAKGGLAYGSTYAMVGDNPNARVDPEVIAPLSKLKDMMAGGGTSSVQIALSGQLTAKGRDLVYVLGKDRCSWRVKLL